MHVCRIRWFHQGIRPESPIRYESLWLRNVCHQSSAVSTSEWVGATLLHIRGALSTRCCLIWYHYIKEWTNTTAEHMKIQPTLFIIFLLGSHAWTCDMEAQLAISHEWIHYHNLHDLSHASGHIMTTFFIIFLLGSDACACHVESESASSHVSIHYHNLHESKVLASTLWWKRQRELSFISKFETLESSSIPNDVLSTATPTPTHRAHHSPSNLTNE